MPVGHVTDVGPLALLVIEVNIDKGKQIHFFIEVNP